MFMAKQSELVEKYEELGKIISKLRKKHVHENDPSYKLKWENDLKEAEKERERLGNKLNFLKKDRVIFSLAGMPNEVHCIFNNHVLIGRLPTCGFWIDKQSEDISRFHAFLNYKLDKNEYWIQDLKSLSGIYVDGVKIQKPTKLLGGSKIQLGESLSLLFEQDKNNPLSPCVMIQQDDKGKEVVRYILIPKGKALVGTNSREVVQFPIFREQHSLGILERRPDGFYFISVNNEESLLEDHQILELDFVPIEVSILKIVPKEDLEETKTIPDGESSLVEPEKKIKKPSGDELPPNIDKFRIILRLFILVCGFILPFIFKPNPNTIIPNWIEESASSLKNVENADRKFWRVDNPTFPPQSKISLLSSEQGKFKEYFVKELDLSENINKQQSFSVLKYYRKEEVSQFIENNDSKRNKFWLAIEERNTLGLIGLRITYWTPDLKDRPTFQWEKGYFLYKYSVILLIVTLLISTFIHNQRIEGYRKELQDYYDNFQKRRTARIFTAQSNLDEARKLAQSGELAKSLSKINNEVLNSISKSMPLYKEAIYLKNSILKQISAGGGSITVPRLSPERLSPTNNSKVLYLRILGTPYAYQAPYGLETIRIGRQRRKPNSTEENVGNDVILRVPGSNERSLRISRRHLEIKWINDEYYVIDKSGGQTKLNGQILKPNEPCRLESGNRLFIAGVITLEVLIRSNISGTKINNVLRIDSPESQDALLLEASIGDMVTEVFDD